MVALAQAWRLTLDVRYKDELFALLESWWLDNPVQRGINWASALEVAFRALSWTWVYHLTAADMPEEFRGRFLTELYRHGLHLDANLSVYFSPNTHLLGEAVALHALGALCPFFPGASAWVKRGARIIADQMEFRSSRMAVISSNQATTTSTPSISLCFTFCCTRFRQTIAQVCGGWRLTRDRCWGRGGGFR